MREHPGFNRLGLQADCLAAKAAMHELSDGRLAAATQQDSNLMYC